MQPSRNINYGSFEVVKNHRENMEKSHDFYKLGPEPIPLWPKINGVTRGSGSYGIFFKW